MSRYSEFVLGTQLRAEKRRKKLTGPQFQLQWETSVFARELTLDEASTQLPAPRHRLLKDVVAAQLQNAVPCDGVDVAGLKKLCRRRYQEWELSQTPLSHGITDQTKTWGQLRSIVTFNTNKIPWTSLGSYLQLVSTEVSFSVLCLQELYDDTHGTLQEGWWIINQHA
eukprot:5184886-Amphidinium_carterae.1